MVVCAALTTSTEKLPRTLSRSYSAFSDLRKRLLSIADGYFADHVPFPSKVLFGSLNRSQLAECKALLQAFLQTVLQRINPQSSRASAQSFAGSSQLPAESETAKALQVRECFAAFVCFPRRARNLDLPCRLHRRCTSFLKPMSISLIITKSTC